MPANPNNLVNAALDSGVTDERLIEALRVIPRAAFVPVPTRTIADEDRPIPIAHNQVTTQPSLSALMIQALQPDPTTRVLEVGTGLGFQTALLAHLAAEVVTIEVWEALADKAASNLESQGIQNVKIQVGDGTLGVAERSPYGAILVSAASTAVPSPLVEQLAEGGRLVQPIGTGGQEMVTLYEKTGNRLERVDELIPARFVRMVGREAPPTTDDPG